VSKALLAEGRSENLIHERWRCRQRALDQLLKVVRPVALSPGGQTKEAMSALISPEGRCIPAYRCKSNSYSKLTLRGQSHIGENSDVAPNRECNPEASCSSGKNDQNSGLEKRRLSTMCSFWSAAVRPRRSVIGRDKLDKFGDKSITYLPRRLNAERWRGRVRADLTVTTRTCVEVRPR
jgi:hypothetical protein